MNWYRTITASYNYIGNCVDCFDEDGDSSLSYFRDASDFAVQDENSQSMDDNSFLSIVSVPLFIMKKIEKHHKEYLAYDNGLLAIHDLDDDIHYFFGT